MGLGFGKEGFDPTNFGDSNSTTLFLLSVSALDSFPDLHSYNFYSYREVTRGNVIFTRGVLSLVVIRQSLGSDGRLGYRQG